MSNARAIYIYLNENVFNKSLYPNRALYLNGARSDRLERDEEIIEYKWFNFDEFKTLKEEELMDKRVSIIINDFFSNKVKCSLQIIKGVN
jgi:hypothetical protein